MTAHLRRAGWEVNRKRVYRLMEVAGWLHGRPARRVWTTDSKHGLPIHPNLLRDCGWRTLTEPNQAWGADLTYVRLSEEFSYPAVLLDMFSRRIVDWDLWRSLEAARALAALDMTLARRQPPTGWIYHSDRGIRVPTCG